MNHQPSTTADLQTRALWVEAPGRAALRTEPLPPPRAGTSLLAARFGVVSAGTERLVSRGAVPPELHASMACRSQGGTLALPVKYGYCLAGDVLEGELAGERAFCMHPHQDLVRMEDGHAVRLPSDVPTRRAVLFPNLETALNAVWDAELRPRERCVVFGAGALGLLTAFAIASESGELPLVVEPDATRRRLADGLPWVARAVAPGEELGEPQEVAFHTSATARGLQSAMDAVGFEGRVIELSWYGTERVELSLGGTFHSLRKRLIASQVAHVAPRYRRLGAHVVRTRRVLELLADAQLDALLGEACPFSALPALIERLAAGAPLPTVPLIDYSA